MNKQLILARFNENIDWVKGLPEDIEVIVYNKGDGKENKLPNIGREAHTYLHHLCNGHLADKMAFMQADPWYHCGASLIDNLLKFYAGDYDFYPFAYDTLKIQKVFGDWVEGGMLYGTHYLNRHTEGSGIIQMTARYFPDVMAEGWTFHHGACFGVSLEAVKRVRTGLLHELLAYTLSNRQNPIHGDESHVMERMWKLIFTKN